MCRSNAKFQVHNHNQTQLPVKVRGEQNSYTTRRVGKVGKFAHTHLFKSPESFVEIHPNPPGQCSRTRARVAFKTTWLFVTAPTAREERRRARAFAGVHDLQERFFSTLRENKRLWEENCRRKRKIYEWILFCFALKLFFCLFWFTLFTCVLRNDYVSWREKLS